MTPKPQEGPVTTGHVYRPGPPTGSAAAHRPLLPPTPCPTCGGAGIVDTSPPGVEGSAP